MNQKHSLENYDFITIILYFIYFYVHILCKSFEMYVIMIIPIKDKILEPNNIMEIKYILKLNFITLY